MSTEQDPEPEETASGQTAFTPLVPASPDQGAGGHDRDGDAGGHDRDGDAYRTPSRNDILHKLDQMPGLIAIGLLPPAKANAMKGVYHTMLAHIGDSPQPGAARVADEDVIKILRQQPELLKALQPFLTPEQLELIIREAPK
jgi:hypothetical protein